MNRSAVYSFIGLLLVAIIGILAVVLAARSGIRYDFSRNALFSMNQSTIELARKLEEHAGGQEIEMIILADPGTRDRRIAEALEGISGQFRGISLRTQPRDGDPMLTAAVRRRYTAGSIQNNSLVVRIGSQVRYAGPDSIYEYVSSPGAAPQLTGFNLEPVLVTMMESLLHPRVYTLGFIQGHGEFSPEQLQVHHMLNRELFQLKTLRPQIEGPIPDSVDLVAASIPASDYSAQVLEELLAYLDRGGRVMLLYDGAGGELPRFKEFVHAVGFSYDPVLVMEQDPNALLSQFQDAPFIFMPRVSDHPVTASVLEHDYVVILAGASPVLSREDYGTAPLLYSSSRSFMVRTLDQSSLPAPGEGLILAAVLETETQRHAAFGSSGLLQSIPGIGQVKGNVELFADTVNWIVGLESTAGESSRSIYRLPLRIQPAAAAGLTLGFSLGIPVVLAALGLAVWFVRKRR